MKNDMTSSSVIPIIIGTGLTGLAISKMLSAEKIAHVLIGDAPTITPPKIGEGVEILGVYLLEKYFSEFRKYFYPKKEITYYADSAIWHTYLCGLSENDLIGQNPILKPRLKTDGFIHLDRVHFD